MRGAVDLPWFSGAESTLTSWERERVRAIEQRAKAEKERIEAQAAARRERFDEHRARVHADVQASVESVAEELAAVRDAMRDLAKSEDVLDGRDANFAWNELDRRRARAEEKAEGLRAEIDHLARLEDTPQEAEDEIRNKYPALRTRR